MRLLTQTPLTRQQLPLPHPTAAGLATHATAGLAPATALQTFLRCPEWLPTLSASGPCCAQFPMVPLFSFGPRACLLADLSHGGIQSAHRMTRLLKRSREGLVASDPCKPQCWYHRTITIVNEPANRYTESSVGCLGSPRSACAAVGRCSRGGWGEAASSRESRTSKKIGSQ